MCVFLSPFVSTIGVGRLPEPVAWSGLAIMVGAIGLRVWAARVLGASYTRTLRTTAGQQLVQAGPYRVICHPGYAADIAVWLGAGLATSNIVIVLVVLLVVSAAYRARIVAEEAMLLREFGDDYRAYSRRTWRLRAGRTVAKASWTESFCDRVAGEQPADRDDKNAPST